MAYCAWSGTRLPYGGGVGVCGSRGFGRPISWGDELEPGGEHRMNVFQGDFPHENLGADGFLGTAPVDAFAPNAFGLYNVTGNVWEWCADWYDASYYSRSPRDDPHGPMGGTRRVSRGGSYLCHLSYCRRYRVSARNGTEPASSLRQPRIPSCSRFCVAGRRQANGFSWAASARPTSNSAAIAPFTHREHPPGPRRCAVREPEQRVEHEHRGGPCFEDDERPRPPPHVLEPLGDEHHQQRQVDGDHAERAEPGVVRSAEAAEPPSPGAIRAPIPTTKPKIAHSAACGVQHSSQERHREHLRRSVGVQAAW